MADIKTEAGNVEVYLTKYKSYVAVLTQTGENDPVATVLNAGDSNFLGEVIWTRSGVGMYVGTLVGGFPPNKTFLSLCPNGQILFFGRETPNVVTLNTFDGTYAATDDSLFEASIEIRVYQ